MQARVNHTCYILDFLDVGFNSDEISSELKMVADNFLKQCSTEGINDWDLEFRAVYNNGRQLLISKNKLGTYPSDKYKSITVAIPVPKKEDVSWGVEASQYVFGIDHYDELMRNFHALDVEFEKFANRGDYIKNCLSRSITYSFETGIVIKGVKLKLPKKKL